jgi:alpha-N-acetylglucosamine transferase
MQENERTIEINEQTYKVSELDGVQQYYLQHVDDLDVRIRNTQFSLDELRAAREYFGNSLAASVLQQEVTEAVGDSDE